MKEIEFQHFKKAPHPFEQYGNLPPAAYRNRSLPQDYSSIPQGQDAFINKVGKKQYENKHQSSIKQHWLGSNQNDSLSMELAKQNHKVLGKSLETRDIEGAQGGSLKSPAVRYKQKAQEMKMNGKLNGFDQHEFQQQEYKLQIQMALKAQHSNDKQIGKLISKKGQGHVLNPQKNSNKDKKDQQNEEYKYFLKEKYDDFESKNEQYKEFFNGLKSKDENYGDFFKKLKENEMSVKSNYAETKNAQKPNTYDLYDPKDMPTPKITSREYEYGLSEKLKTIQTENHQPISHMKGKIETNILERNQNLLINYEPPNFAKKSLQHQFIEQQSLGASLNVSRFSNQSTIEAGSPKLSRKTENYDSIEKDTKTARIQRQLARKLNPTNLSHLMGSDKFY